MYHIKKSKRRLRVVLREAKDKLIEELTQYVQTNQDKLYRLAYHYVKEEQLALDMIQDAIVKALTKIHTLKNPEYVKTWFYRILINECLTNIRKKKVTDVITWEDYEIAFEDKDVTETLDIYGQINQLKPKLKTVIVLRFFEDMKLEEIMKVTNTNLSTVKSRLYKALEQLKLNGKEELKNEKIK